jgi:putative two-component system response regulator
MKPRDAGDGVLRGLFAFRDRQRVLVVDDNAMNMALEAAALRQIDCEIVEVGSGAEALRALARGDFDLVLIDRELPDMDGIEVCRRIRSEVRAPLMPIIMVTHSAPVQHIQASLAAGANDYVQRPYDSVELLSRAKCALDKKRLTDQLDDAESVLYALANMVEARDPNTGEHCGRLRRTSRVLGDAMGLDAEDLIAMEKGALLHDIGKIAIPDQILLKPGDLTDAEWAIMRSHAEIGADMCSGLKSIRDVLPIVRHHHERWDGSGYPDGLVGDEIPLVVRVFQFADIYDALRHSRAYCGPMSVGEIIGVLEEEIRRGWRDPRVGEVVVGLLRSSPNVLDQARLGASPGP